MQRPKTILIIFTQETEQNKNKQKTKTKNKTKQKQTKTYNDWTSSHESRIIAVTGLSRFSFFLMLLLSEEMLAYS